MEAQFKSGATDAQQVLGERVARVVVDVDQLASTVASSLARAKTAVVRDLGALVARRAQAMRLAVSMELSSGRLLTTCADLQSATQQLTLMSAKTRLEEGTKLAVGLVAKLSDQLSTDLQEWARLESE